MVRDLSSAIRRGLAWLASEQQSDGSFLCLVSTTMDDYRQADTVPAIVPTNIVLSSLIRCSSPLAETIKQKAAAFLLGEKNEFWSFNYWFRRSEWYTKEPYPDDVDDTFCALAALYEYCPELFDGNVLAKIITMLTSAEKQEGGPYDMWLVPPEGRKTWNDVDLVVNSNVGFFLSLLDVSLPGLNAFIESSIDKEKYEFPYNTIYPGIYFISRFYRGGRVEYLIQTLLSAQEENGAWQNPLRTALALTALMNLSGDRHLSCIEKGIEYLQQTQGQDGGWPVASFFFQMRMAHKTLYAGSVSTTTALCVEALQRFVLMREEAEVGSVREDLSDEASVVRQWVIEMARQRFLIGGEELREKANELLSRIVAIDEDGLISLAASTFRASLGERGREISDEVAVMLGAANLLGWMAYTAYDDVLDEEGGIEYLPAANVCLRTSVALFERVLESCAENGWLVRSVFDLIDGANSWEIARARRTSGTLPEYGDCLVLAHRSLGHALGPIVILCLLGYDQSSLEGRAIRTFFEQYLIARQLNDDAHDWQEDLARGQVNAVAVLIAQDMECNPETFFTTSLEERRDVFWKTTVVRVCEKMEEHLTRAKQALEEVTLIENKALLLAYLVPIERSIEKTRRERQEVKDFLESYLA